MSVLGIAFFRAGRVVTVALVSVIGASLIGGARLDAEQHTRLQDLVFVTEDLAIPVDGCDGISVMRQDADQAVFRGPTFSSPGRMAADPEFEVIETQPNEIVPLEKPLPQDARWTFPPASVSALELEVEPA